MNNGGRVPMGSPRSVAQLIPFAPQPLFPRGGIPQVPQYQLPGATPIPGMNPNASQSPAILPLPFPQSPTSPPSAGQGTVNAPAANAQQPGTNPLTARIPTGTQPRTASRPPTGLPPTTSSNGSQQPARGMIPSQNSRTPNGISRTVLLINSDKANSVLYTLNGKEYDMKPGYKHSLPNRDSWLLEFDRGEGFGKAHYMVTAGTYKFASTDRGWDLIQYTPVGVANSPAAITEGKQTAQIP
jgi:hypothetical protein